MNSLIHQYLQEVKQTNSDSTYNQYLDRLTKFDRWLGVQKIKWTKRIAIDYLFHLTKEGVASSSVMLTQNTLSAFYSWLVQYGIIPSNPLKGAKKIGQHKPKNDKQIFTDEEYQCLIKQCEDEWRCMIKIAWHTGLRMGDIATLERKEIDFFGKYLKLSPNKTNHKTIEIPLDETIYTTLLARAVDMVSGYVLPNTALEYKANGNKGLSMQFKRMLDKCGIEGKSFHSFRHTYITRMLAAGMPVAMLSTITGQSIDIISRHYNKIGIEDKKKFMEKMIASA